ncbi:rhodanese-like domain-containing protein [Paenibacillus lutrae]|uniref:Rhodanese-like domain-containing protein n=1 Tax=Paenibacillus lutrae TaxID=2078573 RepID=A0A7X3FH64_9BACL|nr:rhodanese-like domain-containing protein [Paenibacillus lutrae]MVO99281.1 rhodanese-like domain-containing protein [Paenibacillus lutrae]
MNIIQPSELKARLAAGEPLSVIDVRENEEVAAGMIAGAKSIPLTEIHTRLHEIPKEGKVILVCRSGNRSGKAYAFLETQGFKNLKNMDGGMLAWDEL